MPSLFRQWMLTITQGNGPLPQWPVVLSCALGEILKQETKTERPYTGEDVFIDRDDHLEGRGSAETCDADPETAMTEDRYTYALYDRCHFGSQFCQASNGVLTIGDRQFWLLSYQCPTVDGRCDLLGLNKEGGFVVLECKRSDNRFTPLGAALEGLDYLSSLSCPSNFIKLTRGFMTWRRKLQDLNRLPPGFENVFPQRDEEPSVVVLAPPAYYFESHARSLKGFFGNERIEPGQQGYWPKFARLFRESSPGVSIRFAICTFRRTTSGTWLEEFALPIDLPA